MTRNSRRSAPLYICLVLVLLFSACAGEPVRSADETKLVIAVLGSFAGEGRRQSTELAKAVQLAVDEYNDHPDSSFRVRLLRADTKGTPEGATEALKILVSTDLLIGVIGPFSELDTAVAAPALNEAGVPFLTPTITNEKLGTGSSFRRLIATDRQEGMQLGKTAAQLERSMKVAIFADSTPVGAAAAEGAKFALDEEKVPVSRIEAFSDPKAAAAAAQSDAANAVIFSGTPDLGGKLAASLRSAGYKGRFLATHRAREGSFRKEAGAHAEGTISDCVCADTSSSALSGFVQSYGSKFRSPPSPFAAEAYDGAWMLLEAIQEVEPKPRDIASFLSTARDFRGTAKRYRYQPTGDLIDPPVWLKEFKAGRWVPLGPSGTSRSRAPE